MQVHIEKHKFDMAIQSSLLEKHKLEMFTRTSLVEEEMATKTALVEKAQQAMDMRKMLEGPTQIWLASGPGEVAVA